MSFLGEGMANFVVEGNDHAAIWLSQEQTALPPVSNAFGVNLSTKQWTVFWTLQTMSSTQVQKLLTVEIKNRDIWSLVYAEYRVYYHGQNYLAKGIVSWDKNAKHVLNSSPNSIFARKC